ncbi:MAG: cysteine desulfurase [Bacteroidetes bacterium]|nr:MAG: cysteine desulfurase [Bacteroidota bacterium]
MRVYLDNAATTPILPEVVDEMCRCLRDQFGNPSSTHYFGRQAKAEIETARRKIASHLNCKASEIIFTSGGTEADNMVFHTAIHGLKVEQIITSPIEHHAVLHTAEHLAEQFQIELQLVRVDEQGHVDLKHLEELLQNGKKTLVSLMHANNEIGTLLPIRQTGELCHKYGAYFHSDTVQTMGHYRFDLQELPVDFVTCSAHKLHGPKGVGFLYANKQIKTEIMIHGGAQERGLRSGTENISGIVGLVKALDLAYTDLEEHQNHVQQLKSYLIEKLQRNFPDGGFHGDIRSEQSLYTVLNCWFPRTDKAAMLLFTLDLKGIACSGGSACSSGATKGSHVLEGIGSDLSVPNVRFSFSRLNTIEEVDFVVEQLNELYQLALA